MEGARAIFLSSSRRFVCAFGSARWLPAHRSGASSWAVARPSRWSSHSFRTGDYERIYRGRRMSRQESELREQPGPVRSRLVGRAEFVILVRVELR